MEQGQQKAVIMNGTNKKQLIVLGSKPGLDLQGLFLCGVYTCSSCDLVVYFETNKIRVVKSCRSKNGQLKTASKIFEVLQKKT